jgi:hypothetical protein
MCDQLLIIPFEMESSALALCQIDVNGEQKKLQYDYCKKPWSTPGKMLDITPAFKTLTLEKEQDARAMQTTTSDTSIGFNRIIFIH